MLARLQERKTPKQKKAVRVRVGRPEAAPEAGAATAAAGAEPKEPARAQAGDEKPTAATAKAKRGVAIVDKRATAKFDRAAFMATLKGPGTARIEKRREPIRVEPQAEPPPPPASARKTVRRRRKLKLVAAPKAPSAGDAGADEVKGVGIKTPEAEVKPAMVDAEPAPAKASAAEPKVEHKADKPSKKPKRKLKRVMGDKTGAKAGPASTLQIGDLNLAERLPAKADLGPVRASPYYLSNREIFVNFMTSLFAKYRKEMGAVESDATCARSDDADFEPMGHQKLVRDYLAAYTPYRGLLLYHGLGAGKTCSSIAIAEGLKSTQQIIVMLPASLRMNYIQELKKCGDPIFRKNQSWEFVSTRDNPAAAATLAKGLGLETEYVQKAGGAWVMNPKGRSNFDELSATSQTALDKQLDAMIKAKYRFINYNGMRASHLEEMTQGGTINPFDNCVIVVDEAHNFVSRIVNKLSKGKQESLSVRLYNYLMDATNARVVLLTGTPMINYPNEVGILFNILRGRIRTWKFKLQLGAGSGKVTEDSLKRLFKTTVQGGNVMDYMEYRPTTSMLLVTRNPYGFVNTQSKGVYKGVLLGARGQMTDAEFVGHVTRVLGRSKIKIDAASTQVIGYKALPDTLEDFTAYFIGDENKVKNMGLFKRRILGLSSYFRDIEALMPRYNKSTDFKVISIPMSDFQFGVYEEARIQERKKEMQNAKKRKRQKHKKKGDEVFEETVSTYRIFSRAFCNFVFPRPDIKRPMPAGAPDATGGLATIASEDMLDAEDAQAVQEAEEADEKGGQMRVDPEYQAKIKQALVELDAQKDKFLTPVGLQTYSPKFKAILESVTATEHTGPHLVYSQFRTLEGIGVLRLVFLANGFAEFKLKRGDDGWAMDVDMEDRKKPMFVLYTGTESAEEREMVRNAFNGNWGALPPGLASELRAIHADNLRGEVIKLLMITASGAEGISLKNVRYVHITEPYWHPVRIEQVIGRARRLCSHQDLPEEERKVDVFLYLMSLSEEQMISDDSLELRLNDKSRLDGRTPVTSDQHLYEVATLKENIISQLLQAIREAAIDCAMQPKGGRGAVKCFTFGSPSPAKFAARPSYAEEETDAVAGLNKTKVEWRAKEMVMQGVKYALNPADNKVYDFESYQAAAAGEGQPIQVGTLELADGRYEYKPI